MGEQVRKVIPEDEAAATGLVIGGMLEDLAAETQADPSPYRKPAPEHLSPFQRDMRAINDDEYEERSKIRSVKWIFLWALLAALGGCRHYSGVHHGEGSNEPDTTETNPQAAVAGAQPVPAAPVPQGQEAAPEGPAACVVPPTSLTVASTETLRDRGVNDPAMFLVQWDAGVINNSGEPILVTARIASSDSEAGGDWEGTFARVPAGEAYLWPMSYVTNNAGGAAGPTQWRYVDPGPGRAGQP